MFPVKIPKFLNSEYFYIDNTGWHIEDNAPEELKKEFDNFNKNFKEEKENEKD